MDDVVIRYIIHSGGEGQIRQYYMLTLVDYVQLYIASLSTKNDHSIRARLVISIL